MSRLFKPFEQGDISINRRFGVQASGLSIVKNLDLMGGEVKVYSTPGEGSTFVIADPWTLTIREGSRAQSSIGQTLQGYEDPGSG